MTLASDEGDDEEFYSTMGVVVYIIQDFDKVELLMASSKQKKAPKLKDAISDFKTTKHYIVFEAFWDEAFNADSPSAK